MGKIKRTPKRAGSITPEKYSDGGLLGTLRAQAGWICFGAILFAAGAFWLMRGQDLTAPTTPAPENIPTAVPENRLQPAPVPNITPEALPPQTPAAPTTAPATPTAVPKIAPAVKPEKLFDPGEIPAVLYLPEPEPEQPANTAAGNNAQLPPANIDKNAFPRPALTLVEAQIELARRCFSCGPIDGKPGLQTATALRAFQESEGIPATGKLDDATKARLLLASPPLAKYTVTVADINRLQPVSNTWLGKSEQSALEYETILELFSEKSHAHQAFLKQLNPGVKWANIAVGTEILLPVIERTVPKNKAAQINIFIAAHVLEARDSAGNIVAHFPVSIAKDKEKRPNGQLHVKTVVPNPNYTFNPAIFPESPEAATLGRKLILPPGPNNPVGLAWIGLDLPAYGIHGTPYPEQVGRTESHGCFRLANWDAVTLVNLVWVGMPVVVSP